MIAIAPSAVEQLRASRADALSVTAAADRFGISRLRLEVLAQAGHVAKVGAKVSAVSIATLVARVAERAEPIDEAHATSVLTVTQAMRLLVPATRTLDFIGALLESRVAVIAASTCPVGFRDLRVYRDAARAVLELPRCAKGLLSIPDAAAALGFKQEVTYHLVRRGLLPSTRQHVGRRVARFVSPGDLQRFSAKYQPLVSLASSAGIGSRAALAWAKAGGLEVASGPTIDGGRQYIVRIATGDD